jgi:hypothetical protein
MTLVAHIVPTKKPRFLCSADAGVPNGSPFILLHGWPHDEYSFADVAIGTI